MRKIVLMSISLVILVVVLFQAIMSAGGVSAADSLAQDTPLAVIQGPDVGGSENGTNSGGTGTDGSGDDLKVQDQAIAVLEEDEENARELKALRDQMNKERGIQQQIKLHNLELERTRVQLEQEKALAEMNQLRKSNLGILRDSNGNGTQSLPETKLVFLSLSSKVREAILTINGTNYTVKEGDKPLDNLLIKTINEKGVLLIVNGEKEISLTNNLME